MARQYSARVDANHLDICATLRLLGASVRSTATIGKGFPDAVIGYRGKNHLIEIKDGCRKWTLTEDQEKFSGEWKGKVVILDSVDAAVEWLDSL